MNRHLLALKTTKKRFCFRIFIFLLAALCAKYFLLEQQFGSNGHEQISPWSYKSTDHKCHKEIAFAREFYGYTSKVVRVWEMFLDDDVKIARQNIDNFMTSLKAPEKFEGRGIVFSANPGALRMVSISIKFIRSYGCKIPIEIWHLNELDQDHVSKMEALEGVTVRNANSFVDNIAFPERSRLYAMKGAALLYTSFDEILFLDADNIPARDPTFLFETDAFKETGALFWKDYWMTKPNNPIYRILGLPCVDEHEFESGQMVIKKTSKGAYEALSLAFYMQQNSHLYYNLFHGDKDSFRFAWRFVGANYHQIRPFPGIAGPRLINEEICGEAMVQFSPIWVSSKFGNPPPGHTENPLEVTFYHMNSAKDLRDCELDAVVYYKGEISTDGIADFFQIPGQTCLELNTEGYGFHQETGEIEISQEFRDKYDRYYREWQS